MSLVSVVLTLIIVGVLLWLINTYIPMQGAIKSIINIVVVIAVVLWLLYGFGIISHSGDIHLPAFNEALGRAGPANQADGIGAWASSPLGASCGRRWPSA